MQTERNAKIQRANVGKRLQSEAICSIGDIYRWEKFIFGVAVAQRYNAFIDLSEIQKSGSSDFTHHYFHSFVLKTDVTAVAYSRHRGDV
jgi:hypothetical protein